MIFSPSSFSIFIVIMEAVLLPFKFVFSLSYLSFGELEIPLVMNLVGDVYSLGATRYILSMDCKLPLTLVISQRVLCVLKLMC